MHGAPPAAIWLPAVPVVAGIRGAASAGTPVNQDEKFAAAYGRQSGQPVPIRWLSLHRRPSRCIPPGLLPQAHPDRDTSGDCFRPRSGQKAYGASVHRPLLRSIDPALVFCHYGEHLRFAFHVPVIYGVTPVLLCSDARKAQAPLRSAVPEKHGQRFLQCRGPFGWRVPVANEELYQAWTLRRSPVMQRTG